MTQLSNVALPSGWRIARVGEILKVRNGYAFKSSEYTSDGVPIIRQSNLKDDRVDVAEAKHVEARFLKELPEFIVREGDLLIGMSGSLGKIARYQEPEPALQNQRTGLLLLKPGFKSRYAKLVLKYVEQQIVAEGKGIAVQNVSAKEIEDCIFPLAPENERDRIVAEIEKQFTRLEAGVAGLRRVQANLKRYRAAVLKAACEGKLVPTEACLRQVERGRQAELARQEDRALPAPRPGVFFIYAIRCDNDSIYIGQTQDLQKRWKEHLAGQAADWTCQHKPVLIVHYEEYSSREEAVAREKWLKTGFGRSWLKREITAGRARQAGYETGAQLLERILTERRRKLNGKGKYKEPAKPDTTNLPPLPEGWAWTTIEQVSTLVQYVLCASRTGCSSGGELGRLDILFRHFDPTTPA